MVLISNVIFYILIFLSVYVQVFFFVTFIENRKNIVIRKGRIKLFSYPAVTIVVPIFNEEKTVFKSINSILDLNYPKAKIKIIIVNDGSTDGTANVVKQFESYPNIQIFHKKNGGKYTALNLGLKNLETDFVGGLDADSVVHPEALVRIMSCFENDPNVMAVAPSVSTYNSLNFIQSAQKAEYHMGIYFKKMLGFLGAINVAPGPLTIFRRKVFDDLGPYRHGHNTEDLEIAYRMHKNHYKIENCNDAYIYTNTPNTIKKLYKQRLRWIYGCLNNIFDYRNILFNKQYGNFSFFTLPMGVISFLSVSYLFFRLFYDFSVFLYSKISILETVGWHFNLNSFKFDPFFINTQAFIFLVLFTYCLVLFAILYGKNMSEEKRILSFDILYFFPVFGIIAPFWFLSAMYSTFMRIKPTWR